MFYHICYSMYYSMDTELLAVVKELSESPDQQGIFLTSAISKNIYTSISYFSYCYVQFIQRIMGTPTHVEWWRRRRRRGC